MVVGEKGLVILHKMFVFCGGKKNIVLCFVHTAAYMFMYLRSFLRYRSLIVLTMHCFILIRELPVPVIACLHGMCFGGGKFKSRHVYLLRCFITFESCY